VCAYHGFRDVYMYYDQMSAAAVDDRHSPTHASSPPSRVGFAMSPEGHGVGTIAVPLLAVNALDDPIVHADATPALEATHEGSNLMVLLTKHGGHIGWPTGWLPWRSGWAFSTKLALDFAEAVHRDDTAAHEASAPRQTAPRRI
jgi:predicted alpha/beta-fold hydrolase